MNSNDNNGNYKPTIGLALSSGAFRGLAHLGVIQAFIETGIPIDYIAGSSMGSIIGAVYCSRKNWTINQWQEVISRIQNFKTRNIIDFPYYKNGEFAFSSGKKICSIINTFIDNSKIEELPIPLSVIATKYDTLEKTVFEKGNLRNCLIASSSLWPMLPKKVIDNVSYVDGGSSSRMPAEVLYEKGADIIIGSDVGLRIDKNDLPSILWFYKIQELKCFRNSASYCNYIILPDVSKYSPSTFKDAGKCIREGYNSTIPFIHKIKQDIINRNTEFTREIR